MATETWPILTFPPLDINWRLASVTNSGGVSVGGITRRARTDGGGFWTCTMSGISIYNREQILAAQAIEARMDGGFVQVIVPHLSVNTAPWPGGVIPANPLTSTAISAQVDAPAAALATTLNIRIDTGEPLVGGERFSVDYGEASGYPHVRLYTVALAGDPDVDGVQVCQIRPPLRNALTTEHLNFNSPKCYMRLTNPDAFMDAINQQVTTAMTLQFEEDFDAVA